jgi:hypothetical protein
LSHFLEVPCQEDRRRNVTRLRRLGPAAEQNDESIAARDEVDAITGAPIDPDLGYTAADWLDISWIS